MKQITLSEPAAVAIEAADIGSVAEDKLNIALVYDDASSKAWTSEVDDRLAGVVGEQKVHRSEWKLADLNDDKIFSAGIRALARADVIAVRIQQPDQVPSAFYVWVNLWIQLRQGAPGGLIALVDAFEKSAPESDEILSYLRAVARQGKLDFLLQECYQPITSPDLSEEDLELAEAV